MPARVERSADMSPEAFNEMFMKFLPLVHKVVIKFNRKYALNDTPMFSCNDDIVNYCYVEMRRLGTFSRFDAERAGGDDDAAWVTYVGEQVLAILRHSWQDHCRVNTRWSVSIEAKSCGGHDDSAEQTSAMDPAHMDPNLDWSFGTGGTEHQAEYESVCSLLAKEASIAGMHEVRDLVNAMRNVPELSCAPTARAVAAVLNISVLQAHRAIKNLRELATGLRLAC